MYEMKWLITILLVIAMSVSSSTLLTAQEAEPQSSSGGSITISSFTKPAISEEALNLNISNHNGVVWINSSLFNCEHKVPDYETKAISLSSSIDTSKYNILISNNKYEYDFSNFVSIVPSDTIKELTEEIICDREPEVKGCKLDFGSVIYDLCDKNLTVSVEKSLDTKLNLTTITTILTTKELIDEDGKITYTTFNFRDPEIVVTNVSVGVFNQTRQEPLGIVHLEFNDTDLVFYMPFNDNESFAIDYSNRDLDGIINGADFVDDGATIRNGSYLFQDDNDHISILENVNDSFTFAAWFKSDSNSAVQSVVAVASSSDAVPMVRLLLRGDLAGDPIEAIWRGDGGTQVMATSTTGYTVGKWHFAVAVFRGSNERTIWLDGINESINTDTSESISVNQMSIGATDRTNPVEEFSGQVDEVMVFNRTLSATEITNLYNRGLQIIEQSGTYTSQVFTLSNTTTKQITNITLGNITPVGTNLSVSVRTKNVSSSITDDLLALYDFDGDDLGASTCTDIFGDNDGVISSGSIGITENGYDSRGYQDDGTDSDNEGCAIANNNFKVWGNVTFFVNLEISTVTDGEHMIFQTGTFNKGFDVRMNADDLHFRPFGTTGSQFTKTPITVGNHSIFAFYNGSFTCFDFDGTVTCEASTGTITPETGTARIGSFLGNTVPFNGGMDNVIIWNRTLLQEERDGIRNNVLLTNWTSYTTRNFSNPYFPPTNKVNGTHAQVKVYFETNGTETPILNNITIGFDDFEEEAPSDTTPPAYSNEQINWSSFFSTSAGQWNRTVTDDSNVAYCNVSTNLTAGQTWVNFTNLTSPPKAQINFSTPSGWEVGDVFGIQAHCCDDIVPENCGADTEFTYTIVSEDTCSPTTPLTSDHVFDANDNCVISSAFDAGNNNVMCVNIAGTGTLTIATGGTIVNFNNVFIHGGCDLSCRAAECFG